jgi:hypothetical protein
VAGGSQKKPQLSQEQFEMIMSEQEENAVKRNLMNKQLQLKPSQPSPVKPPEIPKPMSIAE